MKNSLFGYASTLSITIFALSAPGIALAQDSADDEVDYTKQEIVVTGSYIRGTPEDAAQPVDTFSSEDLDIAGVSSPLEFVKDLPQVGSVLGDTNQFSAAAQGSQGQSSINLRGLGSQRTLVLFNGRRTLTSPDANIGGFGDTNMIPMFALDRIEILKDGAAATYGSDAIAGVANFVTKRNFTGLEVAGDFEKIDGSDGNWSASVLGGANFGELNLMAGFGWTHRSELPTTARPYGSLPYDVNPSGWSALATPGTFIVGGVGLVPDRGCEDLGGVDAGILCRFSFMPFNNLIEEEDRYQGYVQANVDLTDSLRWNAEFTYARTDIEHGGTSPSYPPLQGPAGARLGGGFTVSPDNPGVPAFVEQNGLTATPTSISIFLWRPFGWLGNPLDEERGAGVRYAKTRGFRVSTGFEKDFSDTLTGQFYFTYNHYKRESAAPAIVGSRLQDALNGLGGPNCTGTTPGANGCEWFNPFVNAGPANPALGLTNPYYVPGAENSQQLAEWLQIPTGNGSREIGQTFVLDVVFSGELGWELGGGPVGWAAGGQYRGTTLDSQPLNTFADLDINPCTTLGDRSCIGGPLEGAGPFIFLGGTRRSSLSQNVKAAFAEVLLPVTDTIEITGAARFEDYGGSIGSTFNPKGSIRWEASDWLVLRGTVGTTFRAPIPGQVSNGSATSLVGLAAASGNFKAVDIFGNPNDLGPETALTYNVGAVFDFSGFNFSVDYWAFDFEGEITTTDGQAIASSVVPDAGGLANCASPFASLITFDGGACVQGTTTGLNISRVRTQWVNGPDTKTTGLDFQASFTTGLGSGDLTIGGNATHILSYDVGDFMLNGELLRAGFDAVGLANLDRNPGTISPWRGNAYVNYNIGGFNARYGFKYVDGVRDERLDDETLFGYNIPSYKQHDIHLAYDLNLGKAETTLQFSVENFTDEDAPGARVAYGYNPYTGNPLGRVYRFGLKFGL